MVYAVEVFFILESVMGEKFEPKVIDESGYCEKIQSARKCALCYFSGDMNCFFHLHTKEQQERFSKIIRESERLSVMIDEGY